MRKLTFVTFVKMYLMDVSGDSSLSIHKLAVLSKHNHRIIDPLILHCLFSDKMDIFFKYFDKEKYSDLKNLNLGNYLSDEFSRYSFKKIFHSYQRRVSITQYDNETKAMIRENILKMMDEKDITCYRIYTDLKINPGNINDFLKNCNTSKVSLELVKKIYNYCVAY